MNKSLFPALTGVLVAIAITSIMDATGLSMFSALPLAVLIAIFWTLQKFSRAEMGLSWGQPGDYLPALLYPLAVMSVTIVLAWIFGAVDTSDANWKNALLNISAGSTIGVFMVLITEEGFFRGWFWAALKRAGKTDMQVLIWTSLWFTVWHISAISLDTGFDIPAGEIPIYLVNATLIGGIFGFLRMISNSVVVASVCHAVWNALAYSLFGFGEKVGVLGIQSTHIYGPEVGWLGIALNLSFAAGICYWWKKSRLQQLSH